MVFSKLYSRYVTTDFSVQEKYNKVKFVTLLAIFFWGDYISDSLPVNFQCPGPLFLNSTSHRNKSLYRDSVQCLYIEKWTEQWRSSLFSLERYKQSYVNWQNVSLQRPNVPNYVDYYNTSVFLRQSLSKKINCQCLTESYIGNICIVFQKYNS